MSEDYHDIIATIEDQLNVLCNETEELNSKKKQILETLKKHPNKLENVGIDLVRFLKRLKKRIFVCLVSLETSVKNKNSEKQIGLNGLAKEISECKIYNGDNLVTEDLYSKKIKVESDSDEHNCVLNSVTIGNSNIQNNHEDITNKRIDLSLRKNSSAFQETDDEGWVDCFQKIGRGKIFYYLNR